MWCPQCKTEVAVTVDDRFETACCAACGTIVGRSDTAARAPNAIERARELLDRWADPDFDPFGPLLPDEFSSAAQPDRSGEKPPSGDSDAAATETTRRTIHRPHDSGPREPLVGPLFADVTPTTPPRSGRSEDARTASAVRPQEAPAGISGEPTTRWSQPNPLEPDTTHDMPAERGPRDEFSRFHRQRTRGDRRVASLSPQIGGTNEDQEMASMAQSAHGEKPPTNWMGTLGQLLAYAGVLGLTAGTLLVVQSYFGGPSEYGPTGWLILTAGQMLLFLGVVTMVSSGMEQAADEMGRRVDRLGERLIRIERAALQRAQQSPHLDSPPRAGWSPKPSAPANSESARDRSAVGV